MILSLESRVLSKDGNLIFGEWGMEWQESIIEKEEEGKSQTYSLSVFFQIK